MRLRALPGRQQRTRAGRAGTRGLRAEAFPNLITHTETTDTTVPDSQMTAVIDDALARKNLAPTQQYIDTGYLSADLAFAELARHASR